MIAGLDISTSVVGIAILNDDSEVIDLTYCDLRKTRDFWEKIDIVEMDDLNAKQNQNTKKNWG